MSVDSSPVPFLRGIPVDPDQHPLERCCYPMCIATSHDEPLMTIFYEGQISAVCSADLARLRERSANR